MTVLYIVKICINSFSVKNTFGNQMMKTDFVKLDDAGVFHQHFNDLSVVCVIVTDLINYQVKTFADLFII